MTRGIKIYWQIMTRGVIISRESLRLQVRPDVKKLLKMLNVKNFLVPTEI